MGEFTKEPGGHKVTDSGVGWHNEPGGGGWKYNEDPGTGWKTILDQGQVYKKRGNEMKRYIKDPGGSKMISDPGTGMGILDPGSGGDIQLIQVVGWVCMILGQVEDI